jgi:hypothetical protein
VPLADAATLPGRVAEAASPIDDVRGTAAYRRHALACSRAARSRGAFVVRISLTVNGERREADLWGGESLLTALA